MGSSPPARATRACPRMTAARACRKMGSLSPCWRIASALARTSWRSRSPRYGLSASLPRDFADSSEFSRRKSRKAPAPPPQLVLHPQLLQRVQAPLDVVLGGALPLEAHAVPGAQEVARGEDRLARLLAGGALERGKTLHRKGLGLGEKGGQFLLGRVVVPRPAERHTPAGLGGHAQPRRPRGLGRGAREFIRSQE